MPALPSPAGSRALGTLLTQANLSRVRGNWNEAIDHCVSVLQADPSNAAAHALLGDIYAARGRREDAVQWYRMALELNPNPVDQAKLQRIERETTQQETRQARKGRRFFGVPTAAALPSDGHEPVGTIALMGVSPRLWLRGITVASLTFLVVSGAILLGTHNRHRQDNSIARPLGGSDQTRSIAPLPGSEGTLPPAHLGGPTVVPPGATANTPAPPHEGGSGLAPDSSAAAHTVPTAFPETRPTDMSSAPRTASHAPANVPTASVRNVRPLAHGNDSPGFATLSGGMKLAKMASLTNSDEAVLVLSNAPSAGNQDNFRQEAIRNVYRAARNAFATNETAKEASVYIQTDLTEKGGTVLMVAQLDRDSALQSDPDAERPDNLLNRLRSVQWGQ
jgi:tetratricopeptide (TPR) repeat protein